MFESMTSHHFSIQTIHPPRCLSFCKPSSLDISYPIVSFRHHLREIHVVLRLVTPSCPPRLEVPLVHRTDCRVHHLHQSPSQVPFEFYAPPSLLGRDHPLPTGRMHAVQTSLRNTSSLMTHNLCQEYLIRTNHVGTFV